MTGGATATVGFDQPDGFAEFDDVDLELSDEELTALALAADPDEPLAADAVPLDLYPERAVSGLPQWYMPPVIARFSRPWQRVLVYTVIAAFLVIDAFGLCITYGQLVAA